MRKSSYKYMCPKCKTPYISLIPIKYCICGALLVPQTPDPTGVIKDLFEKVNPFSIDMFKKKP